MPTGWVRAGPPLVARCREEDVLSAALELVTDDGIGTSEASRELVTSARAALYNCAISLLQVRLLVSRLNGLAGTFSSGAPVYRLGRPLLTARVMTRMVAMGPCRCCRASFHSRRQLRLASFVTLTT